MPKTVRLRNVNPVGAVDVPLIGRTYIAAGEEFDVSPEHAEMLLQQTGNYERVTTKSAAAPDTAREG